jgi:hypothetical protein
MQLVAHSATRPPPRTAGCSTVTDSTARVDYHLLRGADWRPVWRLLDATRRYRDITTIADDAPLTITAPAHGISASPWPVQIVLGPTALRSSGWELATVIDADTLEINQRYLTSAQPTGPVTGARLLYQPPVDLTGFVIELLAYLATDPATALLTLSTATAGLSYDPLRQHVTAALTAAEIAALTWSRASYHLQTRAPSGITQRWLCGTLSLRHEC